MNKFFDKIALPVILVAGLGSLSAPALADGLVVVGGDITGTFELDPVSGLAGNRTFYGNVLGGASQVAISSRTFNSFATGNLQNYYGGSLGATVTSLGGVITPDSLADIGLLALVMPNISFIGSEIAAIGDFTRSGGTLLLLGEASEARMFHPGEGLPDGTIANTILNDLLAGIGATIRLDNNTTGYGVSTSDIGPHALTTGISSFGLAYVSSVNGGESLIRMPSAFFPGSPSVTVFAAETLASGAVPEPASWATMIGGFALAGGAMRRRKIAVSFA